MYNLDDESKFRKVLSFEIDKVYTYGDKYKEKREHIRDEAQKSDIKEYSDVKSWAFRINIVKKGLCDIDNVPKLIIDSFSEKLIKEDKSEYKHLALYGDDTIENVKLIQIYGTTGEKDNTKIEIFGCIKDIELQMN